MLRYETERYAVDEKGGRLVGREKKHCVLKEAKAVTVRSFGEDVVASVRKALEAVQAGAVLAKGDRVAIKINLGGGIHHVPSSYSDPVICEAIIMAVRELGGDPFVCEADMRAHVMHEKMLRIRGYWEMLQRNQVEFVNLSRGPTVEMTCRGLDIPLRLPEILLRPRVKIISFAPPKHHWECGITCNQKNMYGAIADYRKSIYHRKYDRINHVVAAAARMLSPDINFLATFDLGAGLGPHFCIPIAFNRMIVSRDMIRGDKAASELLGYPFHLVKYAMINAQGEDVDYELHPDSDWPSEELLKETRACSITPGAVRFWKALLYPQYFVPHAFQITAYPPFEFLLTWINRRMFQDKRRP